MTARAAERANAHAARGPPRHPRTAARATLSTTPQLPPCWRLATPSRSNRPHAAGPARQIVSDFRDALCLGVRDEHLGILFLLLATPVAASSHVMVAAARGDSTLAANIIVLTTLLSLVTITAGFFTLAYFSMVGQLQ